MSAISKRTTIVAAIIALFAVSIVGMLPDASAEITAHDKAIEFLSSVVGLDLAKYVLMSPTPPPDYDASRYPPQLCGIVKEESPSFTFEAARSKISVMSIFYNGQLSFFKISNNIGGAFFSTHNTLSGGYIYAEPPAADLLNQAKNILNRYQAYVARVDSMDNSYLAPMLHILNSLNDLAPTNVTVGNINFQVSKNEHKTRLQWIYTENGVSMNYKRLELAFRDSDFELIIDNWRLYRLSGPSIISAEEAYKLALEAAQKCELRLRYENGTTEIATLPDLTNAFYEMYFSMVPYRNDTFQIRLPSEIPRDPLTLYPYWQFYFYFPNGEIGGCSGIQVSLWGDTGEIRHCSGFGYYGAPNQNIDEDTNPLPTEEPTEEQQQEQPNLLDPTVLAIGIIIVITLATSITAIAYRHRKQQKH
ncbi:MAG: hypothetical protein QXU99_04155 [Candidatus Bathyarchaeia archaeon]